MQFSVISVQARRFLPNQNRTIAVPVDLAKVLSDQGESMMTL